jgi:hypothetical protein
MGHLMHVLAVDDVELPLVTLIPEVPSATRNTSISVHFVAFLGSLSMLPPPVPSASLLSLGFGKFGRSHASCSSCVFRILEGLCQLVVLSI